MLCKLTSTHTDIYNKKRKMPTHKVHWVYNMHIFIIIIIFLLIRVLPQNHNFFYRFSVLLAHFSPFYNNVAGAKHISFSLSSSSCISFKFKSKDTTFSYPSQQQNGQSRSRAAAAYPVNKKRWKEVKELTERRIHTKTPFCWIDAHSST